MKLVKLSAPGGLDMIRAIAVNRLKPVIARRFPLQDIAAALRHYESQQHFGKVCLEF